MGTKKLALFFLLLWPAFALAGQSSGLRNFYVSPTSVVGGNSTRGVVQLSGLLSSNVTVALSSNNACVSIAQNATLPSGVTGVSFAIQTSVVSSFQNVTLTATLGVASLNTTLGVSPYSIKDFYVSPATVAGGITTYGVVQLSGPAGPGGNVITIEGSSSDIVVPSTVTVPQGKTGVSFPVMTTGVSTVETDTLIAASGPVTLQCSLELTPAVISSFSTSEPQLGSGQNMQGTLRLLGRSGPSGTTVTFESTNASLVVPTSVVLPAGVDSVSFPITSLPTSSASTVTLSASEGTSTKQASVILLPAEVNLQAILAQSSKRVVTVEVLGDSITWSANAGDPSTEGFVALSRDALQQQYGDAGLGFRSVYYSQQVDTLSDGYVWSFPQGWSHYQEGEAQNQANIAGTGLGVAFGNDTVAGPAEADVATVGSGPVTFNLYYSKGSATSQFPGSSDVFVGVDGSALGFIDCTTPGSANLYGNVATFTYQPAATEVQQGYFAVEIQPEDSNYAWIEGIDNVSYATGVKVDQLGLPGIRAGRYVASDSNSLQASTLGLKPDILVVEFGLNDLTASNPKNSAQTNAATIAKYINEITLQPAMSGVPIVLMGVPQPPSLAQSPDYGAANADQWPAVIQQLKHLATNNDFYFVSIFDLWHQNWQWPYDEGYMWITVHPTTSGHVQIASALENLLSGLPTPTGRVP